MNDTPREFKDRLYGRLARLGKALSSPHCLEMLELLAQGGRTVDSTDPFGGTSEERVARKYGVRGVNVHALKP